MIDSSMIPDFVEEVQKHLNMLESGLIDLGIAVDDPEEGINAAFKAFNALEKSARRAGVQNIAALSRRLEDLLEPVQRGEITLSPEILEIMTTGRDRLAELIDNLRTFGKEKAAIGDILADIEKFEKMTGPAEASSPAGEGEQKLAPAGTADDRRDTDDTENGVTEDFGELFDIIAEGEDTFAENKEVLAALAGEEEGSDADQQELPSARDLSQPGTPQQAAPVDTADTLSASPADAPRTRESLPEKAKSPTGGIKIDIEALRKEIESEAYDEELKQIFIRQLQDNISLLRALCVTFNESAEKSQAIGECSEIISRLHSSANYMGFDRLTEFYGQWIAELEMAGMDLASGALPSFAFMDRYFNTIVDLFPQLEETAAAGTAPDDVLEEPAPQPAVPSTPEEEEKEEGELTEIPEDESGEALFSDLFSTFDTEDIFAEDKEVIAAFSGEEPRGDKDTDQSRPDTGDAPQSELDQKLDYFFADERETEIPPAEPDRKKEKAAKKPPRPARTLVDPQLLKKEIEEEEYDKELFQIFIQHLQENISQLRTLADEFPQTPGKTSLIKKCSDLLTALHSSANYMGYERLTEFYGQWIAELEMADMQLFIGVQPSLDFMDKHIKTIAVVFPQIEDKPAELKADQHFPAEKSAVSTEEKDIEPGAALAQGDEETVKDEEDLVSFDEEDAFAFDDVPAAAGDSLADADSRRKELFTRLSGALESLSEMSSEQPAEEKTFADVSPPEPDTPHKEDRELFARLSSALEADTEIQAHEDERQPAAGKTEQQLYDRLSSALDEQEIDLQGAGTKSIDNVLSEILTGRALAEPGFKPPAPHRPEMDDEAFLHARDRSVLADRRLVLSDRRRGPEDRRLTDPLQPTKLRGSIRVDTDKIENLMNRVEELIINRANISQLYNEMGDMQKYLHETARLNPEELRPLQDYANRLDQANTALGRVSSELQEGVLNVRMMPVAHLFKRYPRFIKDLVRQTDKKVKFTIRGEETELDKMILEEISESLLHIISNCIEHGIETTAERRRAGKDETANLLLEAYPESNAVVIEISDDGRGIDPQVIKEKVLELNLLPPEELESMSGPELVSLIMTRGFSTATSVPRSSGRGDGMDEVRENIENLKGRIDIRSQVGVGTMIRITIPLALSVIKSLAVRVGEKIITVPLAGIVELTRVRQQDIEETDGIELIQHRDAPLPVFRLSELLNIPGESTAGTHEYILVVKTRGQRAGLIVDGFMRPREAVVKPLVEYLKKESGFSGATIRDDGTISLVLDIPSLLAIVKSRLTDVQQKTALEFSLKGLAVA